jgi:hypothetical protein
MRISFNQVLYAAGAVLGLGAVAFGGYMTWNLLNPPKTIVADIEPGCDLHKAPCRANLPGGGTVTLAVAPRPIPLAEPIRFEVEVTGVKPEKVEADVGSLDMYMGYNRRALTTEDDRRYTGRTVLAVCSRETMRWRVTLLVRSGRMTYSAPFDFLTVTKTALRKR